MDKAASILDLKHRMTRKSVAAPSGCLEWIGKTNRDGYGVVSVSRPSIRAGTRDQLAHRAAWLVATGAWPALCVLHACDNRRCVSVEHLFLGTNADNVADMVKKGRAGIGKLHGESNPVATLTEEKVRILREALANGLAISPVARALGVKQGAANNAARGKHWKHVI